MKHVEGGNVKLLGSFKKEKKEQLHCSWANVKESLEAIVYIPPWLHSSRGTGAKIMWQYLTENLGWSSRMAQRGSV